MDGRSKKIKRLIAACLVGLAAGAALCIYLYNNTNYFVKLFAAEIREDQKQELDVHYQNEDAKQLKTYYFVPEESGEYLFTVSDINCSDDVAVGLYVANNDFTEYMVAENYIPEDDNKELSGSTYLQQGAKCYISTVIISMDEPEAEPFDGSVCLTVSKKPEYTEPPLLTEEEDAVITLAADGRGCARFMPAETGYFRFDTSIVSKDASSGFSSISSIISPDNLKTQMTEGIAYLEKDKEYYIWVTVHETGDSSSEVSLSVNSLALMKVSGASEITLTEDTVIEYHADKSEYMAVYSSSDGNPNSLIYETAGFALRTDEDGEDSLSDNDKDFAMVFSQEAGKNYCICVYGDLGTECKVTIVPYTGDGSSLTPEDVDLSVLKTDEEGSEGEGADE